MLTCLSKLKLVGFQKTPHQDATAKFRIWHSLEVLELNLNLNLYLNTVKNPSGRFK